MTVTSISPAVQTEPVITITRGQELMNAVHNALLFTAPKSANLDILRAVRFEREKGDKALQVIATDRYRLFIQEVPVEDANAEGCAFQLEYDDAKQLTTALKAAGRILGAGLVVSDLSLRVKVATTEMTLPMHDVTYPKYKRLMSDPADGKDTGFLAFNPTFLGHLGKLKLSNAHAPAQFTFFGPNKPVLIHIDDTIRIMQMPVRINDAPAAAPTADTSTEAPAAAAA